MNVFFMDDKVCVNKEKTAAENADEIKKDLEKFKEYITGNLADFKLESRSGIANCKRAIAEMHGLIEEQEKKIKALEEKIDKLAGYAERDFSELDKRTTKIENTLESMHKPESSEKAIYTKYIDNGGRVYYMCGKCHALMQEWIGDRTWFCPECRKFVTI